MLLHKPMWKGKAIGMKKNLQNLLKWHVRIDKFACLTDFSDVQNASHINHNQQSHPHEKPIDLVTKMIEHSSKEGDLILNPFGLEEEILIPLSISLMYLIIISEFSLLKSGIPDLTFSFHFSYLSL